MLPCSSPLCSFFLLLSLSVFLACSLFLSCYDSEVRKKTFIRVVRTLHCGPMSHIGVYPRMSKAEPELPHNSGEVGGGWRKLTKLHLRLKDGCTARSGTQDVMPDCHSDVLYLFLYSLFGSHSAAAGYCSYGLHTTQHNISKKACNTLTSLNKNIFKTCWISIVVR